METLQQISKVNTYVTIAVFGSDIKTAIMPLWAAKTNMPGAWVKKTTNGAICNIWDINRGISSHMFPSLSVDHAVVVIDGDREDNPEVFIIDALKIQKSYVSWTFILVNDNNSTLVGNISKLCVKNRLINYVFLDVNNMTGVKDRIIGLTAATIKERKKIAQQRINTYLKSLPSN